GADDPILKFHVTPPSRRTIRSGDNRGANCAPYSTPMSAISCVFIIAPTFGGGPAGATQVARAPAPAPAHQQGEEGGAVVVVGKGGFAVVAAVHEVVAGSFSPLLARWRGSHGLALRVSLAPSTCPSALV